MNFDRDGFEIIPDVIPPERREALTAALAVSPSDGPGSRDFLELPEIQELARGLRSDPRIKGLLPDSATAVQCTYFHKSASMNWLVPYHQDLSIPVKQRIDAPSWSGWSVKQGVSFAQPPLAVLEALTAVRVHLDESSAENGPLRVIPGSHALGRIGPADIARIREIRREFACAAPQRSALIFKPLLLHASSKSRTLAQRRVLHFLFGPLRLPDGLEWRTRI